MVSRGSTWPAPPAPSWRMRCRRACTSSMKALKCTRRLRRMGRLSTNMSMSQVLPEPTPPQMYRPWGTATGAGAGAASRRAPRPPNENRDARAVGGGGVGPAESAGGPPLRSRETMESCSTSSCFMTANCPGSWSACLDCTRALYFARGVVAKGRLQLAKFRTRQPKCPATAPRKAMLVGMLQVTGRECFVLSENGCADLTVGAVLRLQGSARVLEPCLSQVPSHVHNPGTSQTL